MKLVHVGIDMQIMYDKDSINELIIESPDCFMKYIRELIRQTSGIDGEFVLSEKDMILNISKSVEVIVNPFTVDVNDKKILGKIYDELKHIAYGEKYYVKSQEMYQKIMSYIIDVIDDSDYILDLDSEIDMSMLLKAVGVKIGMDPDDFVGNIFKYMQLVIELLKRKLVVIVNLRSYIDDIQYNEFIGMCRYKKINVLLIENSKKNSVAGVKQYIIDKDRCEIF